MDSLLSNLGMLVIKFLHCVPPAHFQSLNRYSLIPRPEAIQNVAAHGVSIRFFVFRNKYIWVMVSKSEQCGIEFIILYSKHLLKYFNTTRRKIAHTPLHFGMFGVCPSPQCPSIISLSRDFVSHSTKSLPLTCPFEISWEKVRLLWMHSGIFLEEVDFKKNLFCSWFLPGRYLNWSNWVNLLGWISLTRVYKVTYIYDRKFLEELRLLRHHRS